MPVGVCFLSPKTAEILKKVSRIPAPKKRNNHDRCCSSPASSWIRIPLANSSFWIIHLLALLIPFLRLFFFVSPMFGAKHNTKTFRPKKKIEKGTKTYQLHQQVILSFFSLTFLPHFVLFPRRIHQCWYPLPHAPGQSHSWYQCKSSQCREVPSRRRHERVACRSCTSLRSFLFSAFA